MDHPLFDLVEQRIRAAQVAGAFEDLAGAGKALPREDDPQNALLRRLLRDNGAKPAFVALARELAALRAELAETGDRTRRREILKEMSMMDVRIEIAKRG